MAGLKLDCVAQRNQFDGNCNMQDGILLCDQGYIDMLMQAVL